MLKDPKVWGMIVVGALLTTFLVNKVLINVPGLGRLLLPTKPAN